LKSNRALLSSITDEIRAKPDGSVHVVVILLTKLTLSSGFFITYMGSAAGTSPGRLVETDDNFNIISEWPEDIAGTANILGENFNPHGLTVDWEKNIILTSDFVIPVTILKPSLGIVHDNTLRLWNLASRTIISTITIPNVSIAQT
jgi:selenium-binding protein 1